MEEVKAFEGMLNLLLRSDLKFRHLSAMHFRDTVQRDVRSVGPAFGLHRNFHFGNFCVASLATFDFLSSQYFAEESSSGRRFKRPKRQESDFLSSGFIHGER